MKDPEKPEGYWARIYEDTGDGPYHPFRDHKTKFGWGVIHRATGRIFALIGEKGCAFGLAAALNGKWEAAQIYMDHSLKIEDEYFERFDK